MSDSGRCVCGKFGEPYRHAGECTALSAPELHRTAPNLPSTLRNAEPSPTSDVHSAASHMGMVANNLDGGNVDTGFADDGEQLDVNQIFTWWTLVQSTNREPSGDELVEFLNAVGRAKPADGAIGEFLTRIDTFVEGGPITAVEVYSSAVTNSQYPTPREALFWLYSSQHSRSRERGLLLAHPGFSAEDVGELYREARNEVLDRHSDFYGEKFTNVPVYRLTARADTPRWVIEDLFERGDVYVLTELAESENLGEHLWDRFVPRLRHETRRLWKNLDKRRRRKLLHKNKEIDHRGWLGYDALVEATANPTVSSKALEDASKWGRWRMLMFLRAGRQEWIPKGYLQMCRNIMGNPRSSSRAKRRVRRFAALADSGES